MGGELQVESEPGKGSRFWFEIEVPVSEVTEITPLSIGQGIVGYTGAQCCVLVVDDNQPNRSVLANLLEPLGFDVVEAENGEQAVARAQQRHPAIILMDLVMPGMSGLEATRVLRQIPDLQDLTIIGVSASTFETDQQAAIQAGCDDFLPKPVEIQNLLVLFEKYLQIEWEYDEVMTTAAGAKVAEDNVDNEETTIIPPDAEKLDILHHLAMSGDMDGIRHQADQLELQDQRYRPFAARLRKFARNFQDDLLLAFVEQYKNT